MDAPTLIYLFRHGAVREADRRRFIGHRDVPLSPDGEAQCRAQARWLLEAKPVALYASDLARAYRSAQLLGAPLGLEPVPLPALREVAMGRWEGLSADEIERREPSAFATWAARMGTVPFPEGESLVDVLARAWPALEAIVRAHAGRTVAVVAHGGTNRALLCRALGVPLDRALVFGQDYAALTVLEADGARWRLRRLNEGPVL